MRPDKKLFWLISATLVVLLWINCFEFPKGDTRSFEEIGALIQGKNAAQIVRILGEPDAHRKTFKNEWLWSWWNYTYLESKNYRPENRGKMGHLQIFFKTDDLTSDSSDALEVWDIQPDYGIRFELPGQKPCGKELLIFELISSS